MTPDPRKWWATNDEIDDARAQAEYGNDRTLCALLDTVARRRAVEELKALAGDVADGWIGLDVGRVVLAALDKRIAAIEAEEA